MKKTRVHEIKKSSVKNETLNGLRLSRRNSFAVLIVVLISFFVYLPILQNGFVNWDDDNYILNNTLIFSLQLKEYFTQFFNGNYHPVTLIVMCIEYQLFGLNETGYHFVSLLLHLFNVILVFYSIFLLSDKIEVALIVSLLFGIHPMHVESVAWASELKDLLYTFFFLLSYIFYLKFINDKSKKYYLFSLLFFTLSLFSKAMAVSLPVLMLLTDYFKGRKLNKQTILEKIPFFILALAIGIVAVFAQKSINAIMNLEIFTFPQRIIFASYGFITYLEKLLLPIQLCSYYPYPIKTGESFPIQYYFYLPILLGIILFTFYTIRFSKKILFGIGFFAITIFLVLQLLPVGEVIMADRYIYIPSIGLFYLAGEGIYWLSRKINKIPVIILLSVFMIFFSIKTYSRCFIWKDGATLWDDVIRQYKTVPVAYNNRGFLFYEEGNITNAMSYYNKAIELSPKYHLALNNRGVLLAEQKRNKEALADYNKVIEIKPEFVGAYNNRGLLFLSENKFSEANKDFDRAILLDPNNATSFNNRGFLLMNENKYAEALAEINKAIKLHPQYAEAYTNRGTLFMTDGKYDEALGDFNSAIESKPDYSLTYFERGILFMNLKRNEEAIRDFTKTIELEPTKEAAYLNRAIIFLSENKFERALNDFNRSIELQPDYSLAYFNRGVLYMNIKRNDEAKNDFSKTIELEPTKASAYAKRGFILQNENKYNEAIRDYNQAIQINPELLEAYFNRGMLFEMVNKFEEAVVDFTRVIVLDKTNTLAYFNRGIAYYYLNKKQAACSDIQYAADKGVKPALEVLDKFCR